MKIEYQTSVKTPAGWRSIDVQAIIEKTSEKTGKVTTILLVDGEKPAPGQSRTGARRQQFNGLFVARLEVGKKKRLSSCKILGD